tara:strand:+ start:4012 stop:7134 length:3123 start_codon:yes stop_codon:yes gene_type:complete
MIVGMLVSSGASAVVCNGVDSAPSSVSEKNESNAIGSETAWLNPDETRLNGLYNLTVRSRSKRREQMGIIPPPRSKTGTILCLVIMIFIMAIVDPMLGTLGLIGAIASRPSDSDERQRDLLKRYYTLQGRVSLADGVDKLPQMFVEDIIRRHGVLNEGAVLDLDEEERQSLQSSITTERIRRLGSIQLGSHEPFMERRISQIESRIDELGIRKKLLNLAASPYSHEREKSLEECVRIVAKMTLENEKGMDWDVVYNTVIAIGDPQMGKTILFLMLSILSGELGRSLLERLSVIVIISGRPKEPRTQTLVASEVLNRWSGNVRFRVMSEGLNDISAKNVGYHQKILLRAWESGDIPVIVVKKDTKVLEATKMMLSSEEVQGFATNNFGGLNGLLIHDEADEAAVPQRTLGGLANHSAGIHGQVLRIKEILQGPYVAFTATEDAIFSMDPESGLFPKRLVMLTPGQLYVGPEFWMLESGVSMNYDCAQDDFQYDKETLAGCNWNTTPRSVKLFLLEHVVSTAVKRHHNDDAVSKALANVSNKKNVQYEFERVVNLSMQEIREGLEEISIQGSAKDEDVTECFLEVMRNMTDRLTSAKMELPYISDILAETSDRGNARELAHQRVAKDALRVLDRTQTLVLNEDTDSSWDDNCTDFIVITGNKGGRAVVFKGLTSMFMPLDPCEIVEDTNIQRLRCCGYRDPTSDLPFMSLFLRPGVRKQFVKIVRNRIGRRAEMHINDLANNDMTVTVIPFDSATRTNPTGLSRRGLLESLDSRHTNTTIVRHDGHPVDSEGNGAPASTSKFSGDLVELLKWLRDNSASQAACIPESLGRGVVFFDVKLEALDRLGDYCDSPNVVPSLQKLRDTHESEGVRINVVFRVNDSGRDEDRLHEEVKAILVELGWDSGSDPYMLRRSVQTDDEGRPEIHLFGNRGFVRVKQLVGGAIHEEDEANGGLGHDHHLDGVGEKNGSRFPNDPSIFVFGTYKLVNGHASSNQAVPLFRSILLSARTPDRIAIAQRSRVNTGVQDKANEARNMIPRQDGEEE